MNPRRLIAYILFIIAAFVSAVAGIVIKFTLTGITPLPFLTYRFGLAGLLGIVLTILLKGKGLPKKRSVWIELLIFSFLSSTIALVLLFFGLEKTTVLDMSIITAVYPLVTVAAGVIFLKEHITKREKIGMAIALAGTALVLVEPILRLHDGLAAQAGKSGFGGNLLIFIYLFVIAATAVMAKRLLRFGVGALAMSNMIFIVGFLTITPFAVGQYGIGGLKGIISSLSLPYHLGVFYMAFASGSLAYFLTNKAQKTVEVSEAALFGYLTPLLTAPLAVLFLGEQITLIFAIGAMIVIIGVAIAEYKRSLAK